MPIPLFPFVWQYNNQTINTLANDIALLLPQYDDYTTNVAFVNPPAIPFIIYPTLIESGTKIIDVHTLTPNLPLNNLSGWKIGGSVVLQNATTYTIPLGKITVNDPNTNGSGLLNSGFFPWKTSGNVISDIGSFVQTNEPIGPFNTVSDATQINNQNYARINFNQTLNWVTPYLLEVTLELKLESCPFTIPSAGFFETIVSFELEFLINDSCTITYMP